MAKQVAVHRKPNVGDGALAQPGHEVKAKSGRHRHYRYDQQQILKPARNIIWIATRCKTAVDNQPDTSRYRQRSQSSDRQRQQGKHDLLGIGNSVLPDHTQITELFGTYRSIVWFSRGNGKFTLDSYLVGHAVRLAGSGLPHNVRKTTDG